MKRDGAFIEVLVLCSHSPSLAWLVAATFVQGLGGAAVMAPSLTRKRFTVPDRLVGGVIGSFALVIALSTAATPGIGLSVSAVLCLAAGLLSITRIDRRAAGAASDTPAPVQSGSAVTKT